MSASAVQHAGLDVAFTRPKRVRVHLTAAGRTMLAIAAAGAFGGWLLGGTSGLFAAAVLALIDVAPVFAWLHTRSLALALPRSRTAVVGQRFVASLAVLNRSSLFAAREVELYQGERVRDAPRPNGYVADLRAGEACETALTLRLTERGRTRSVALVARSSFPFGLLYCSAEFELPCDLVGLPRLGVLSDLGRLPVDDPELAFGATRARTGEEELHGVRDWREGESLRRVHWRLSARRDRLVSREYRPQALPAVRVLLVTGVATDVTTTRRSPAFERAVSLTATLVDHYLRQGRTVRLAFSVEDGESLTWTRHRGRAGLYRALLRLAEVAPRSTEPLLDLRRALLAGASGRAVRWATRSRAALRSRSTPLIATLAGDGRPARVPGGVHVLDVNAGRRERAFVANGRREQPAAAS